MTPGVIVIAQVRFKDDVAPYNRYLAAFPEVFANSGGRIVGAVDGPKQIDGSDTDVDKIIVLRFDDEAAAQSFFASADYQRISVDRDAGAHVSSFVVNEL